jgi:hypothetical protein
VIHEKLQLRVKLALKLEPHIKGKELENKKIAG